MYETARLLLTPTSIKDSDFILNLFNSPKFLQFIGNRNLKTALDAEIYIKTKMISHFIKFGFSNYTITLKETGVKIGCCGLYVRDRVDGVDIGIGFLPEYEGLGYGYESGMKLMEIAPKQFQIDRIYAISSKNNYPSQNLIKKLGMHYLNDIILPNEKEVRCLYSNKINV